MFAALGMNGTTLEVFAVAETETDAENEAMERMVEADVELVDDEPPALALLPVTDEQAAALRLRLFRGGR